MFLLVRLANADAIGRSTKRRPNRNDTTPSYGERRSLEQGGKDLTRVVPDDLRGRRAHRSSPR
jgi:hypothetical protein